MSLTIGQAGHSLPDSSGIAITLAVHAFIALIALSATGIVTTRIFKPAPIVTSNVPEKTHVEVSLPPKPDFVDVRPTVVEPIIDIEAVPPKPDPLTARTTWDMPAGATSITPPVPPLVAGQLDLRFRDHFQPPYPAASLRNGEEGRVVVHVLVGIDGRVKSADVVQSSGHARLDEAAVRQALGKWRFIPAMRGETPIESWMKITVLFELNG